MGHGKEFVFFCLVGRNWKVLSKRRLDLIYILKRNTLGAMWEKWPSEGKDGNKETSQEAIEVVEDQLEWDVCVCVCVCVRQE